MKVNNFIIQGAEEVMWTGKRRRRGCVFGEWRSTFFKTSEKEMIQKI